MRWKTRRGFARFMGEDCVMLKLYHGSNVVIDKIDLSYGHINQQLDLYEMGLIGLPQLIEGLRFRELNNQYYFGTDHAVAKLKKI